MGVRLYQEDDIVAAGLTWTAAYHYLRTGYPITRSEWNGFWKWNTAMEMPVVVYPDGRKVPFDRLQDLDGALTHTTLGNWVVLQRPT